MNDKANKDYDEKLALFICDEIAVGKSLVKICKDLRAGGKTFWPQTVYAWIVRHEDFRALYEKARQDQADHYADEIVALADDVEKQRECIDKARLQIDARKWCASKLKPKKYGDKVALEGGEEPIKHIFAWKTEE